MHDCFRDRVTDNYRCFPISRQITAVHRGQYQVHDLVLIIFYSIDILGFYTLGNTKKL